MHPPCPTGAGLLPPPHTQPRAPHSPPSPAHKFGSELAEEAPRRPPAALAVPGRRGGREAVGEVLLVPDLPQLPGVEGPAAGDVPREVGVLREGAADVVGRGGGDGDPLRGGAAGGGRRSGGQARREKSRGQAGAPEDPGNCCSRRAARPADRAQMRRLCRVPRREGRPDSACEGTPRRSSACPQKAGSRSAEAGASNAPFNPSPFPADSGALETHSLKGWLATAPPPP